jgi:hypothetical protein
MNENPKGRFQFRLKDAFLVMTFACALAPQLAVRSRVSSQLFGAIDYVTLVFALCFYEYNQPRRLWVTAFVAGIASAIAVAIANIGVP